MTIKTFYPFLMILLLAATPAPAQDRQSANDIVEKMQHDLNLSGDQVANITQVIERYTMASDDLQKSIDDGTIDQSAIDSQKQQIKAAEDQGIAQYLRSDQLSQWNNIQGQEQKQGDAAEGDTGADQYSNLPKSNSPQN